VGLLGWRVTYSRGIWHGPLAKSPHTKETPFRVPRKCRKIKVITLDVTFEDDCLETAYTIAISTAGLLALPAFFLVHLGIHFRIHFRFQFRISPRRSKSEGVGL
jgi:hypothetical protein